MKKYVYLITLFSIISIGLVQGQAVFTVTNTSDPGYSGNYTAGSLAKALKDAQASGAATKVIRFDFTILGANPVFTLGGEFRDATLGLFGTNITLDGITGRPVGGSVTFTGTAYNGSALFTITGTNNFINNINIASTTANSVAISFASGSGHKINKALINGSAIQAIIVNSSNTIIDSIICQNLVGPVISINANGAQLLNSTINNTSSGTGVGVLISASQNSIIKGNTISNNNINGIQLVGNCAGTVIGGCTSNEANVITGNGYSANNSRDDVGCGIVLGADANSASGTNISPIVVKGNYIGISKTFELKDVSNISYGNSAHGISIFTGSNITIGELNCPNYIGNNGFRRIASGIALYVNSSAVNIQYNNIGTDGLNGLRFGNNFDGITLQNGSNNITIANNTIGNNINAIGSRKFSGAASTNNIIRDNLIGVDKNNNPVGNFTSGISIEVDASNYSIFNNKIKATGNNFAYGNGTIIATTPEGRGIKFDGTSGNGNHKVYSNIIGKEDTDNSNLSNTGEGIYIKNSSSNYIGYYNRGNKIANLSNKTAILIDGASTINNRIVGNSLYCQGSAKAIFLTNTGNTNYSSGNSSLYFKDETSGNGKISGKAAANTIIHIYRNTSTCNQQCTSNPSLNFVEAKTFVDSVFADVSGNWSYSSGIVAGTENQYSATATSASGNTSELLPCTATCIAPSLTPIITANPKTICPGSPATITIQNGETGVKYVAYLGSTIVSDSGNITTLNLLVNRLNTGINSINVRATASNGCTTVVLSDTATIRVNAAPNITFTATGGVFCSNATATVTLSGSETGVTYQVFNKTTNTAISNTINGTNNALPINLNTLSVGTVIAEVRATRANCTTVTLTDTALVVINSNPTKPSASTTSPLCFGSNAVIVVANSQSGVNYQVFEGATAVSTVAGGGNTNLNLTVTSPSAGAHTYVVRASNVGCSPSNSDNVVVQVNNSPTTSFLVSGGKFCSNPFTASVTLSNSQNGVSYQLLLNGTNTTLSGIVNNTGSGSLNIPLNSTITSGVYNVQVSATIPGCAPVTLSDTALVTINTEIGNITATASATEFCQGLDVQITFNTKSGVNYQVFENNIAVSTIIAGDGNPQRLIVFSPTVGAHTYQIRGTIAGCTSVNSNTVNIQVKSIPINTLTISTDKATICEGGEIIVNIGNATELGVTYNLFDNGVLIATKTGNGATLPFPQTITGIGNHTFTVTAVNNPCSAVTLLDNESITVNPGLNLDLAVNTNSPLCSDVATTTIKLIAAQANVSYQLFDSTGTTAIGSPVSVSSVQDIEFIVSPVIGINKYLIKATDAGCGTVVLNNKATIFVNKKPNAAINVSTNSPLCEGNDVIITLAAENGVTYEAFEGVVSKGSSILPTNTIRISGVGFGLHTYNIIAKIAGCVDVPLTTTAEVIINKQAKSDLTVSPIDTICENSSASIQIFNAEDQVTYQIFKNSQLVSSIKQVGNSNLSYNVNGLGGDTLFLFTFSAQSPGCTPINLVNSTSLWVYKNPNLGLNFSATKNEICKGAIVDFTVGANTATNATYTLFEETKLISSQVGNGNSLDFSNITLNTVGTRTFKILVNNKACSADTLNAKVIIKVNEPADKNLGLTSSADTICIGKTVAISASPAQKDVKYVLFDNNVKVDSATATTDNETLSFKNLTLITSGNHLFTLTAQRTGCDPVLVNGKVNVYVNKDPKKDIDLSYSGLLCITNPNTLLVLRNSERNVLYDVTGSLTTQLKGDGSDISIALTNLPLGISSYQFKATLKGCDVQNLSNSAVIEVRDTVNTNLDLTGMSICAGDTAIVGIKQSQLGVSYQLTIDKNTYSGLYAGNNNDIFIRISPDKLASGLNLIKVKGFNSPCPAADLKDSTEVYKIQNNYSIQGKSFICEFNVDTLEISPKIPGATSYTWTVPKGVTFTALSADSSIIKVQYGNDSTSGTVKVIPHATLGKCDNLSNIINVQVLKPLNGVASILLRDTVCLFDTDTLEFGNVVNVSGYQWSWTDSIQTIDTLVSPITYDKIVIKYMSTGFDTITLKLYSPCLVEPLVITKVIRILGPPTVDAGTYGIVLMLNKDIRSIDLNPGVSTSENGPAPNDTLAYQWTELRGSVVDKSDDRDNASFKPRTLTNIVQLQVYHKALPYCAASDTAKVIIDLGIVIPNVFTPNNEGPLDTEAWNITNLSSFYPNATLQIYNKWGALLREFRGGDYSVGWDGTRNGQDMPVATYYFILDLKNGIVHTGSVTLLR